MKFFGYMKNKIVVAISNGNNLPVANKNRSSIIDNPYNKLPNEPFFALYDEVQQLEMYCPDAKSGIPLALKSNVLQKLASLQMRLR